MIFTIILSLPLILASPSNVLAAGNPYETAAQIAAAKPPAKTEPTLKSLQAERKLIVTRCSKLKEEAKAELTRRKIKLDFNAALAHKKDLEGKLRVLSGETAKAQKSYDLAESNLALQRSMLDLADDANRSVAEANVELAESTFNTAEADLENATDAEKAVTTELKPYTKVLAPYVKARRELTVIDKKIEQLQSTTKK